MKIIKYRDENLLLVDDQVIGTVQLLDEKPVKHPTQNGVTHNPHPVHDAAADAAAADFGNQFRNWRNRKGFTQQNIADMIGCHFTIISTIERGLYTVKNDRIRNAIRKLYQEYGQ